MYVGLCASPFSFTCVDVDYLIFLCSSHSHHIKRSVLFYDSLLISLTYFDNWPYMACCQNVAKP